VIDILAVIRLQEEHDEISIVNESSLQSTCVVSLGVAAPVVVVVVVVVYVVGVLGVIVSLLRVCVCV
jgi:hypothetical protein